MKKNWAEVGGGGGGGGGWGCGEISELLSRSRNVKKIWSGGGGVSGKVI